MCFTIYVLKWLWSICNYQVNTILFHGIFETDIFDNISLILFRQKNFQFISHNLDPLREHLLFSTAGCHHHLHFCLICMGLHNLNEIVLHEKKNWSIFVLDTKSESIFLLIIYCRESNLISREFMLSCAKIQRYAYKWSYDVYFPKL